mmetsp:Transcript_17059/g.42636  ORF Transcript_17059/g.42636 Transcript_17059/m.42636 type:complete len:144 (-) Transcript_17059:729-1160(-)
MTLESRIAVADRDYISPAAVVVASDTRRNTILHHPPRIAAHHNYTIRRLQYSQLPHHPYSLDNHRSSDSRCQNSSLNQSTLSTALFFCERIYCLDSNTTATASTTTPTSVSPNPSPEAKLAEVSNPSTTSNNCKCFSFQAILV